MIWLTPSEEVEPVRVIPIEKDHHILRIPVFNFADLPRPHSKEKVSLFHERKGFIVQGYLREILEDPLGASGKTGVIEVPGDELEKFKKAQGAWQVYPPLNKGNKSKELSAYEVNF